MAEPERPRQAGIEMEKALHTLARAIALSQGQFSLIVVRCNSGRVREQMMQRLRNEYALEVLELYLSESAKTLYSTIRSEIGEAHPCALTVAGFEEVVALDDLLTAANRVRDEFAKSFKFPLVLWVNDEVLERMMRIAPDFYNWAGVPIRLALFPEKLQIGLSQKTHHSGLSKTQASSWPAKIACVTHTWLQLRKSAITL